MSTITLAPRASYQPRPVRTVRLTRRGRLVVFAFGVLLAFALGVWFAAGSVATQESGVEQVDVVTVAPGDTLWDIASDAAEATGGSTGDMVDRIQDMNSLDSSMVYAGQKLRIPTE
jgi:Tfp pilus assembly protein FimV